MHQAIREVHGADLPLERTQVEAAGRTDGAIARARAGEDGEAWPRERTVIVGDTPRDIACARADGLRVIAVTTGPFDAQALAEADHVSAGGDDLAAVLADLAA